MKLYTKDGRLRFDYEHQQTDIFVGGDFDFSYIGHGQREYIPYYSSLKDEPYPYERDWAVLKACVEVCKAQGVEITPDAQTYIDDFKAKGEADAAKHEEAAARYKAQKELVERKKKWLLCVNNGCKYCPNLRYDTDMPWCKATHHKLEEKNAADIKKLNSVVDGVYHIFMWIPFPDDNCPFKTEPLTADEMREFSLNEDGTSIYGFKGGTI